MTDYKITVHYGGTDALTYQHGRDALEVANLFQSMLESSKWITVQLLPNRVARVQTSSISHFVVWQ